MLNSMIFDHTASSVLMKSSRCVEGELWHELLEEKECGR